MNANLLAQLKQIGLTQIPADASNPQTRWAFEAGAALTGPDGVATGLPDLRIGVGNSPDADQLFGAQRTADTPGLVEKLGAAQALWLGTGTDATLTNGTPDRPVWLAVFSTDGIDLLGAHPLPQGALDAPGLLGFPAPVLLRLRLRLRGTTLDRAEASLEGPIRLLADFGPVRLSSLEGTFRLALASLNPGAITGILTDPASVLDAQFAATLTATLRTTQPVGVLDGAFTGAQTIELDLAVTSPARSRSLSVQRVAYRHSAAGSLSLGGTVAVGINAIAVHAQLENWQPGSAGAITIEGTGTIKLPPQAQGVVTSPTANIGGRFTLTHQGSGASALSRLAVTLDELALAPQINPLELSARSMALTLSKSGAAAWSVEFAADLVQSWEQLATRLRQAGIVDLPRMERLPDLQCQMRVALNQSGSEARLDCNLLEDGPLGPFPLVAAATRVSFTAAFRNNVWEWTATGSGRFSSRGDLAALVPFQELPISCSLAASAVAGELPSLEFMLGAGLPSLKLPPVIRGGPPVDILKLDELTIRMGQTLEVAAKTSFLPNLGNTAARLGVPSQFRPLLDPLLTTVQGSVGTFRFAIAQGAPRLDIRFTANPNAAPLDVFALFAQVVPNAAAQPAAGAKASAAMPPLLLLKAGALALEAEAPAGEPARLRLSASAVCTVLGETFDATFAVQATGNDVEISLLAGSVDPIRINIPASGTAALVASIDQQVQSILTLYGVNRNSQAAQQLRSVANGLRQFLGSPETDTLIAFEIVNLGLTLRVKAGEEPLTVTGGIRIVQFPPILDMIFTGPTPALIIGSSGKSIFIELRPAPASGPGSPPAPLIRIPVTGTHHVDVVIHALRFGYGWQPPSFELTLRSDVIAPDLPFQGGVGFKLPAGTPTAASASMDIEVQVPSPPAPPVPVLNWQMSFLGANPTSATRGLEFIVGPSNRQRWLTVYLRETVFSPTFFLLMPGGLVDFGMFLGPPPEFRTPADFYFDFRLGRGTMITMNPFIGVQLNPLALLPPFLSPMPPYWVIPGLLMGDYFTDESGQTGLELRGNIPGLVEFEVVVKRPLPVMNLQMFLEIAMVVIQEFEVEIPPGSALKNLFYAGLSGRVRIPFLAALFGDDSAQMALNIEFNIVEILNGALRLNKQIREAVDDTSRALSRAATMVANLVQDPKLLVKMVPREHRSIAVDTDFQALGFTLGCNLSAYLLLPEELLEELRMFHEDIRPKRKGPGAFHAPAPAGPVVSGNIVWDIRRSFLRAIIESHRDFVFAGSLARIDRHAKTRFLTAATAPIATSRDNILDASATRIATDIEQTSGMARRAVLNRYRLAVREADIDADERITSNRVVFRDRIKQRVRSDIGRAAKYSIEVVRVLAESPEQTAAKIVNDAISLSPGRRAVRTTDLDPVLGRHLRSPRLKRSMAAELDAALQRPLPTRTLNPREFDILRQDLASEIAGTLRARLSMGRVDNVDANQIDEKAADIMVNVLLKDRPNTKPKVRNETTRSSLFRGKGLRDSLLGFRPGFARPRDPSPPSETDEPQGHEIRVRPPFASAAPTFAEHVPSTSTRFKVRLEGGRYRLVIESGGTVRRVDLPPAFVASVPFGPSKAAELQHRLYIAEKRVHRPLTTAERALQREDGEQHVAGLYKQSILFSPEYEIRPEGGRRGPLYLADLLRKDDGTYVVPGQPVAIAGFNLQLLKKSTQTGGLNGDFHVRFCGLVAPGSHLLCFGYAEHTLQFGSFRVDLNGEFHLAVGDIAAVNVPGSAAITPNSMSFRGIATLRDGSNELLSGEASASVAVESGLTKIKLKVRAHVEWAVELEIGEVKLLKVWLSADFDVTVTLGRTLEASLDTAITLSFSVGAFKTETVTVGFVVCIPLTDLCWRETTDVEVVDLTEMEWGPEQTVAGRLALHLSSSTAGAQFAGVVTADIPLPGGGTFQLSEVLPSLTLHA